jgi:hypothetical protein
MTVKQLRDKLCNYPEHWEVYLDERKTEFTYGLLNTVSEREITILESEDGEDFPEKDVVVLSED